MSSNVGMRDVCRPFLSQNTLKTAFLSLAQIVLIELRQFSVLVVSVIQSKEFSK